MASAMATHVSTHSHPKVAASDRLSPREFDFVSTHSHPKVAAAVSLKLQTSSLVSTHSHPKVAASRVDDRLEIILAFQHTATRRWLRYCRGSISYWL